MTATRRRPIVLDRDGVINVDVPGKYVCSAEEWIPIDGALSAMGRLTQAGFDIYVVSNQSGIGRGFFDEQALAAMHAKLLDGLKVHDGAVAGWFYCPHTPADDCNCRKPATGMLEDVATAADTDLAGVAFVGDKQTDMLAARAMRMRGMLVGTGHGSETLSEHAADINEYFADLSGAANALIDGAVVSN